MQAVHSFSGKDRRNLGWVGTVGIYQHKEFIMLSLLSHATPAPHQATPHLSPDTGRQGWGHESVMQWGGFPGSPKQMQATVCSTQQAPVQRPRGVVHPCAGADRAPRVPQGRWAFRRFLRPALAPRWAPFISPLNWPCIFACFLGRGGGGWVSVGTGHG